MLGKPRVTTIARIWTDDHMQLLRNMISVPQKRVTRTARLKDRPFLWLLVYKETSSLRKKKVAQTPTDPTPTNSKKLITHLSCFYCLGKLIIKPPKGKLNRYINATEETTGSNC